MALTVAAGCSDYEESCYKARTVELAEVPATFGEVRFESDAMREAGSYTYQVVPTDGSSAPPENTCWASLIRATVYEDSHHDLGATDDLGGIVEFHCTNAAPYLFPNLDVLAYFADVRLITPETPSLTTVAYCQSCATVAPAGSGCTHYADPSVLAEALQAEGGPSSYPGVVTPDFSRELHVRLDMGRVAEGDQGVCQENVQVTAEATFSVTAARYHSGQSRTMCAL